MMDDFVEIAFEDNGLAFKDGLVTETLPLAELFVLTLTFALSFSFSFAFTFSFTFALSVLVGAFACGLDFDFAFGFAKVAARVAMSETPADRKLE